MSLLHEFQSSLGLQKERSEYHRPRRDYLECLTHGYDDAMKAIFETLLPEQPIHQLVLQIDTDDDEGVEIAWHDDGISNILMKSEDLKVMNFDKYIYTWDTL